jgi:methyl-accepting chemotaxis protein
MDQTVPYGQYLERYILDFSNLVTEPGSAGVVSAVILSLLLFLIVTYGLDFFTRITNLKKFESIIKNSKNETDFKEKFETINEKIRESSLNKSLKGPKWPLQRAWDEYCETILHSDRTDVIRNTMRPAEFFNSYELGFERGLGRQWVNIFVTLGLFATFLGIIAALRVLVEVDTSGGNFSNQSMANFLDAAKSKFIMSLTGLGASITFNFVYRFMSARGDAAISSLCDSIEQRVTFQTPEQIADNQLVAIKEQTEQLQAMANNLGAQIGSSVGDAVAAKLEPVLERIGASAGTEVEGLVGQLGDTIFEKLNASLNEVSATLNGVNSSMREIAERLQASSNNVGEEMTSAVKSLSELMADARKKALDDDQYAKQQRNEHLQSSKDEMDNLLRGIEENTRKGSVELSDAATKISKATEDLKDAITNAADGIGDDASNAVAKIGQDAATKLGEAGTMVSDSISEATDGVLANLTDFSDNLQGLLGDPVQNFADALKDSNRELQRHAEEIIRATNTQSKASGQLDDSTKSLQNVSRPISDALEQIRTINAAIAKSLEVNSTLLEGTNSVVESSMSAIKLSIEELSQIVKNADNIDEKLGMAFKTISDGLNKTQIDVKEFTDEVHSKFAEGITSIQSVLDGLDDYIPGRRK